MCEYDIYSEEININNQETCIHWSCICIVQCEYCYWNIDDWYFLVYIGFTRKDALDNDVTYHGIFNRTEGDVAVFAGDASSLFQGVAAIFFCYVSHQMVFPLI